MTHFRIRPGFLLLIAALLFLTGTAAQADQGDLPPVADPLDGQLATLQREKDDLATRIRQLESISCIPAGQLHQRKARRLKEIAANVKVQRQSMSDFEGFVKWMSTNLAGYNRYIQAGSYVAVIGRMLPIPYAGQASVFTKFVAQFTVALNAASVSINNYLVTSQKFVSLAEPIDPARADDKQVAEAALFADQQLLKSMGDTRTKLATVSDLSSGALSFLDSLNHYVSGTDEYWNKAKGLFCKDIDPKEKSFISESTGNLKSRADRFNARLRNFEELSQKEYASVKALRVYDELAQDLASSKPSL